MIKILEYSPKGIFIRIATTFLFFSILLFISCYCSYESYWLTKYRVQTVDLNILHQTLATQIAYALKYNDRENLQRVIESNFSLFGIVVTDKDGREVYARNNAAKKMGINEKDFLVSRRVYMEEKDEPYDEIIWPPKPNYYNIKYENPFSLRPRKIAPYNSSGMEVIGRIYYFRPEKPPFMRSLSIWLSHYLLRFKFREWDFFLIIYSIVAFSIIKYLNMLVFRRFEEKIRLEKELQRNKIEYLTLENQHIKLQQNFSKLQDIVRQLERSRSALKDEVSFIKKRFEGILGDSKINLDKNGEQLINKFERFVSQRIKLSSISKEFTLIRDRFSCKAGEIDHLLISKYKSIVFVLEDKYYYGTITGDANSLWYSKMEFDEEPLKIEAIGLNPYTQIRNYVFEIVDYIKRKINKNMLVIGIVVFPDRADLSYLNIENIPKSFYVTKVSNLDNILIKELTGRGYRLSKSEQSLLTKLFK